MSNLRLLHIATLNSGSENIGVVRQMQCEMDVARDLGLNWETELWVGDSLENFDFVQRYPETCRGRLARRRYFAKVVENHLRRYDFVVVRYMPADPFLMLLRHGPAKLAFVHHSKEAIALKVTFGGLRGSLYALADWVSSQVILRKADGLIGVTQEIINYEKKRARLEHIPTLISPNGIDLQRFPIAKDERLGSVKLVFTASTFFAWHGLSTLLKSMEEYSDRHAVELHLVGRVQSHDLLFIEMAGLSDSVTVHGPLGLEQLMSLLAAADVGIASFGLGEAGLQEACTLKVREYLAAGVAVFSGHRDVAFPDEFDFYRIGLPDIASIVKYAQEMRRIERTTVRQAASAYIDKSILMTRMYHWAASVCGK